MPIYGKFSQVYDLFMEETPYEEWVAYIEAIWRREGTMPSLVAELACGTGSITIPLAQKGYEMTGIDLSEEMLTQAKQKAYEQEVDILFLNQDMRAFELYGTMDSILCVCDGLNYILEEDELLAIFRLVKNYLNPGGTFIFDMNTLYKFEHILGDNTFTETSEDAAYIWENYFDEETQINEYYVNFFVKQETTEKYERFEECHYERGYTRETIENLLTQAGLTLLHAYDATTFEKAKEESSRIYFVARG